MASAAQRNIRSISYAKYGYFFILPFFLVYCFFQLWPLINTFIPVSYTHLIYSRNCVERVIDLTFNSDGTGCILATADAVNGSMNSKIISAVSYTHLAGIIAMRPECIVLDEPTAMLDPNGRKEVMRTITELNQK